MVDGRCVVITGDCAAIVCGDVRALRACLCVYILPREAEMVSE